MLEFDNYFQAKSLYHMLKSCPDSIILPLIFKFSSRGSMPPGPPRSADSVWSPPNISYSPATFLDKENPVSLIVKDQHPQSQLVHMQNTYLSVPYESHRSSIPQHPSITLPRTNEWYRGGKSLFISRDGKGFCFVGQKCIL